MGHRAATGSAKDTVYILAGVTGLCIVLYVSRDLDLVAGSNEHEGESGAGLALACIAVIKADGSILEVDIGRELGRAAEAVSYCSCG